MEQTEVKLERYVIESGLSRFTVRAFAGGMLSALGHNPTFAIRDFTGEIRLSEAALPEASLSLSINAASLTLQDDISEKDRKEIERTMNRDVLDSGRFPKIEFKSASASVSKAGESRYLININGNLTLRSQTHSQAVPAQVSVQSDTLRANGEFALLQSKYGIKPISFAGGTLKLKDELKFTFDIVARRQE